MAPPTAGTDRGTASVCKIGNFDKLTYSNGIQNPELAGLRHCARGVQLSPLSHCFATRLVPDLVTSERLFNYSVFVEWMLSAHGYRCKDSITGKSLICHVETFVV